MITCDYQIFILISIFEPTLNTGWVRRHISTWHHNARIPASQMAPSQLGQASDNFTQDILCSLISCDSGHTYSVSLRVLDSRVTRVTTSLGLDFLK